MDLFGESAEEAADKTEELSETQRRLNEVSERTTQQLNNEVGKLKALFFQLRETNPESEKRELLMAKINKEYGTTLKNISDETEFINQLNEAYQKVVEQIKKKIALQSQEEFLTAVFAEQNEKVRMSIALFEQSGVTLEEINKAIGPVFEGQINSFADVVKAYSEAVVDTDGKITPLQRKIRDFLDKTVFLDRTGRESIIGQLSREIGELEKEAVDRFKNTQDIINSFDAGVIGVTGESDDEGTGPAREKNFNDQLKKLRIQNIEDDRKRAIELEKFRFNQAKKRANKEIGDKKILDQFIEELEIEHRRKMRDIFLKFDDEINRVRLNVDPIQEAADKEVSIMEGAFKRISEAGKRLQAERDKQREEELNELNSFAAESRQIAQRGLQQGIMTAQEDANMRIEMANQQISNQERNIDIQAALAEQGLSNTLAFEQQIQREREKALAEEQKRLEKIKRIETYYNLFSSFSQDPNTNPAEAAGKALVQLKIGDSVAAILGEGGIVGDEIEKQAPDGILRGPSHKRGGIKVEVEGREGLLSVNEMENLGRDRFYAFKSMLSSKSAIDEFFDSRNSKMGMIISSNNKPNNSLSKELKQIHEAVKDLPKSMPSHQQWIDPHGNLITRSEVNGMIKTTYQKRRKFN